MRRFRTLLLVVVLAVLAGSLPVSAAEDSRSAKAVPSDGMVRDVAHEYQLADSRMETLVGVKNNDGSCTFSYPELTLEPHETAVEARPVKIDLETCVQTIEIGTPPASALEDSSDGVLVVEEFSDRGRGELPQADSQGVVTALAGAGSATVYYEVRWEDSLNITVNRTRAYLDWSWNGSCVTSSSAWGSYYTAFGWSLQSSSGYKTSSCNNHKSVVDWAHYDGPGICDPDTFVNDAWARGHFDGRVNGGVVQTWTSPTCFLHYHTKLVKY